jgi:hypothetical protein
MRCYRILYWSIEVLYKSYTNYIDSDRNPLARLVVFIRFGKIRIQAYPSPIRSAWATIRVGS